jgi:hypothetical protein
MTVPSQSVDYRKFYEAERYLVDEVGPCFRKTGVLEPADLYTIFIWKAERVKNQHKKRLAMLGGTFDNAVRAIASGLFKCSNDKDRLKYLMDEWHFLLPTASAILTILYPKVFTVYDWRVCDELNVADYDKWKARGFSDNLWNYYQAFKVAVERGTPSHLSLRDKDRFLIGRSTRSSIEADSQ